MNARKPSMTIGVTSRWKYFKEKWAKYDEMKRFSYGFGWDPVTRTFTAPDEVLNDYFKSHPKHASLRYESNSDFEILQVIVGQVTSTGNRMKGLDGFRNDVVRELRSSQNDERDTGDFNAMRDDTDDGDEEDDEDDGDGDVDVDVDDEGYGDGDGDEDILTAPLGFTPITESDASAFPCGMESEGGRISDSTTVSARKRSRDSTTTSKGKREVEFDYNSKISVSVSRMCDKIGELTEIMSGSKAERTIEIVEKSKEKMEKSLEQLEKSRIRDLKMRNGWEELCQVEGVGPDARYYLMDVIHKNMRILPMFLEMNEVDRMLWVNYKLSSSVVPYFPNPP